MALVGKEPEGVLPNAHGNRQVDVEDVAFILIAAAAHSIHKLAAKRLVVALRNRVCAAAAVLPVAASSSSSSRNTCCCECRKG